MRGLEDHPPLADPIVYLLQSLAKAGIKETKILLASYFCNGVQRAHIESWMGLAKSLDRVMPGVQVALIHQHRKEDEQEETSLSQFTGLTIAKWVDRLWRESQADRIESAFYLESQRHVLRISPIGSVPEGVRQVLRMGGTYLITGGMGQLGYLIAEHLAKQYAANLILIGRSPLDECKESRLKAIEELGGQALYIAADVCDMEQMRSAIKRGCEWLGSLSGIIHAAGIAGSGSVLTKDIQSMEAAWSPKVRGTIVLNELLQEHDLEQGLDFVCYFSSISAILGDFGSCDYAVGNRFELAYAKYVNRKAVAICWPLWENGGMAAIADEATRLYLRSTAQRAVQNEDGIELFEQLLARREIDGISHALVMIGERSRLYQILGLAAPVTNNVAPIRRRSALQGLTINQCILWELKEMISVLLKWPQDKLDEEENLAEFGVDSIGLATLAKQLSTHFNVEVLPSLFFSYTTLRKLAGYFETEHAAAVHEHYGTDAEDTSASRLVPIDQRAGLRARSPVTIAQVTGSNVDEPIAIIGMSGRFPGARTVDELWKILAEGRDVVQEIPIERFDWREYYQEQNEQSDDAELKGKTNSKWLGAIPGVGEFDSLFFEISPKEAESMDPRQRLLLQESFNALEDAGYGAIQLTTHKIGMFVGAEQGDYQFLAEGHGGNVTANHDAVLAARLSYFLNLRGPAMTINTACSSGLVAAHQACSSLRAGECDTAIAASANLILTPHSYLGMSQMGMLSPDGKCYAFDRRANGMVPGEAAVAVVLKRLSQAESDNDLIYAVIRGNSINYDGKTNGLTAPSGAAQTELIKEAYARAHIEPKDIEYVVTHGTGTRLGDPVEINALREAFKGNLNVEPFCALTSTKTNLGHTFAASGLVNLVSLVQALRHEIIPPSLHCEQLSDYIDWKRSPFYVNTKNKAWPARAGKSRLGAVSAFGMSGTNAHMILEEFQQTGPDKSSNLAAPSYLLVLSAKTEEALRRRAQDLIEVLEDEKRPWTGQALAALSYTLLNHRQHFNHRWAIVIESREQAITLLEKALSGETLPSVFKGNVARDFVAQPVLKLYADDLVVQLPRNAGQKQHYRDLQCALCDLYCQGYPLNGGPLYGDHPPKRVSLPTYPFARRRHWAESSAGAFHRTGTGNTLAVVPSSRLHPLLHQNTSTFAGQIFSSTFSGEEFFLSAHVVNGKKVLPAAAYLEMAHAAVFTSLRQESPIAGITLQRVVWMQPLVVSEPVNVHIKLSAPQDKSVTFEIYTTTNDAIGNPKESLHAQGRALWTGAPMAGMGHAIDVPSLLTRCTQSISKADCYEAFRSIGIEYGAAHRGLDQMQYGVDATGNPYLLGKLSLPYCVNETHDQYVLHPSMLDSALQASFGLSLAIEGSTHARRATLLPFAIEELTVLSGTPRDAWVVVQPAKSLGTLGANENLTGRNIQRLDINIYDEQGLLCLRIKGFTSREWAHAPSVTPAAAAPRAMPSETEVILLAPIWQVVSLKDAATSADGIDLSSGQGGSRSEFIYSERWILLDPAFKENEPALSSRFALTHCLTLTDRCSWSVEESIGRATAQIFEIVQSIAKRRSQQSILLQIVLAEGESAEIVAALSGLLKTARHESTTFTGQIITVPHVSTVAELFDVIEENASDAAEHDSEIRYINGTREVSRLTELSPNPTDPTLPWKEGGIYAITGGTGALGLIIAQEIAARVRGARIILTGRSGITAEKRAQIATLTQHGDCTKVEYRTMDVTDPIGVTAFINSVIEQYGSLNGIVHSAGVVNDRLIVNKTLEGFRTVISPKVFGTIHLDRATRDIKLDFFILFSSTAAVFGNAGQCDYAAGNAFMDRYAAHRNALVQQGKRSGRTLSINWPLWADGGMSMDAATLERIRRQGFDPLVTIAGIKALYRAWQSAEPRVIVLAGDTTLLRRQIFARYAPKIVSVDRSDYQYASSATETIETNELLRQIHSTLNQAICHLLKVPADEIDIDADLTELGFDSISLTVFTNYINEAYELDLDPMISFEYHTVRSLSGYLSKEHASQLTHRLLH
jgi:acyl transferase domain-containing protein/acyl carrier protein